MMRGSVTNRRERVIVRIDESVEDEELDVLKLSAALAFSWHSFGQYQIEVLVEILDQIKCRLIGIQWIDNVNWTTI